MQQAKPIVYISVSGKRVAGREMEHEIEWKMQYGIWKIPEWIEMENFKHGMEDNLS